MMEKKVNEMWEPTESGFGQFDEAIELRNKIKMLSEEDFFYTDPSIDLDYEMQDLITKIKIKYVSYADNKVIIKNLNEVIKTYLSNEKFKEIKGTIKPTTNRAVKKTDLEN